MERTAAEDRSVLRVPALVPKQKGFREQKAVFLPLSGFEFKSLFLVVINSACVSARVCCPCWWKRRRACTTVQRMFRPYPPAWKVGRKQEDVRESCPSVTLALPHTHTLVFSRRERAAEQQHRRPRPLQQQLSTTTTV